MNLKKLKVTDNKTTLKDKLINLLDKTDLYNGGWLNLHPEELGISEFDESVASQIKDIIEEWSLKPRDLVHVGVEVRNPNWLYVSTWLKDKWIVDSQNLQDMNLKKVKGNPKGLQKLYQELDKAVTDSAKVGDSLNSRAIKLEEYVGNLSKLVEDGLSTEQDIIQSLDEILDQDVKDDIARELSEKFDWPESLDDDLWSYVKGSKNLKEILGAIELSSFLSEEDKLVLVDDILDAYEQVEE